MNDIYHEDLVIRQAEPRHAEAMCGIRAANWVTHYPRNVLEEGWMEGQAAEMRRTDGIRKMVGCIESARDDPNSKFRPFVALTRSDEVVGYAFGSLECSDWISVGLGDQLAGVQELGGLHVMERDKGLGALLLGVVLASMDSTKDVVLYTPAHAAAAIKFYRSKGGFESWEELQVRYWGPMKGLLLKREAMQ